MTVLIADVNYDFVLQQLRDSGWLDKVELLPRCNSTSVCLLQQTIRRLQPHIVILGFHLGNYGFDGTDTVFFIHNEKDINATLIISNDDHKEGEKDPFETVRDLIDAHAGRTPEGLDDAFKIAVRKFCPGLS